MRHIAAALRLGISLSCFLSFIVTPAYGLSVNVTNAYYSVNSAAAVIYGGANWNYDADNSTLIDTFNLTSNTSHEGSLSGGYPSIVISEASANSTTHNSGSYATNNGEHIFSTQQSAVLTSISTLYCSTPGCGYGYTVGAKADASANTQFLFSIDTATAFEIILQSTGPLAGTSYAQMWSPSNGIPIVYWNEQNGSSGYFSGTLQAGTYYFVASSNATIDPVFAATVAGQNTFSAGLTLNPVPVPAAVWLFGSALGLIGVMRRKVSS